MAHRRILDCVLGRHYRPACGKAAGHAGCSRVYWQTQSSDAKGRALYDKVAEHKGFIVYTHELQSDRRQV
jgi:hypothetical protein